MKRYGQVEDNWSGDCLIHGYFDVDIDVVWAIVTIDLPDLLPRLQALVDEP